MSSFQRIGLLLLTLLAVAGLAGTGLLYSDRQKRIAEIAQLRREVEQLKDQVTTAAEVQQENRRLKNQVEDLQQQVTDLQQQLAESREARSTPEPGLPTPTPGAEQPTPTPGTAGGSRLSPDQEALLDQIGRQVVEIRGLAELQPAQRNLMTREELRAYMQQDLDKHNTPEDFRNEHETYWLLGMLPSDLDLRQFYLDLLTEQVAGFYDHETKSFYIISDKPRLSALDKVTYAHEFDHHLQDQHFDLGQMLPDDVENDRGMAIRSLVEGDASLLMEQWLIRHLEFAELQELLEEQLQLQSPMLDTAPEIIKQSLLFPYEEGLAFVRLLYNQGGWQAVDQALRDPPSSTEQILHPEKYTGAQRDEPKEVALPDLSGALPGWEVADSNTLGELDLSVMLSEYGLTRELASQAAAGWGGARYNLYRNAQEIPVLVVVTVWDTEQDAVEFEQALRSVLQPNGELLKNEELNIALQRQGDRVSFAISPDEGLALRVDKALR